MKRFLSVLCVALLALSLAACGEKESPQPKKESRSSSVSETIPEPSDLESEGPSSSEESAQPSQNEENLLRFSLGPKGEVKALRAGDTLGDWTLQSYDAQWDIEGRDIPRVDEAVFTAPADAPVEIRCTVSLDPMSSERRYSFTVAKEDLDKMPVMEGDGRDVWFLANNSGDLTALADLGNGETRSCRVTVSRYVFVCLPMMSSNGADIVRLETDPPQNSGDAVVETIPQEEQLSYFRKYIQPYYIVGLLHSTWSSPEEIEVWRYMHFYLYNESGHYWEENPSNSTASIPADIVEDYITSYFEVDPEYLRTSENYDPAGDCYRPMVDEGHGGGPGVLIDQIEKEGDLWKFICRNEETNDRYSVTIRVADENTFHYIAGEGPSL